MGFRYREQLPSDFKVFADMARKMGYRLMGTDSDAERYRMTLPHPCHVQRSGCCARLADRQTPGGTCPAR